jgi:hypothetical protein
MFHPASLVILLGRAEYVLECSGGDIRADKRPNGTYITDMSDGMEISDGGMDYVHSVGLLGKHINHQLLICGFPSSHLTIIVNEGLDIFGNVVSLPALAMKGDSTKSQGLENR